MTTKDQIKNEIDRLIYIATENAKIEVLEHICRISPFDNVHKTTIRNEIKSIKSFLELNNESASNDRRSVDDLRVGDTIVFYKSLSKYITVGKEYEVFYVSDEFFRSKGVYEIVTDNNKTKCMKRYQQGYSWDIAKQKQ